MHDVPILNPNIRVEAVGTRRWNDAWLCVLVTPWSINLLLLPADGDAAERWDALGAGGKVIHRFPAGRFEFIAGDEDGIGRYQMCSLFSPVLEFDGHDVAAMTAEASLDALFAAGTAEDRPGEKVEPEDTGADVLSRRDLFIGKRAMEQTTDEH